MRRISRCRSVSTVLLGQQALLGQPIAPPLAHVRCQVDYVPHLHQGVDVDETANVGVLDR